MGWAERANPLARDKRAGKIKPKKRRRKADVRADLTATLTGRSGAQREDEKWIKFWKERGR